ncbi:MAG: methyl-accepting chemotaxis protein [Cyanobacteria bacterium P01_A01_bin.135]
MTLASDPTHPENTTNLPASKRRFRINSLGTRLFLIITGGVLAGMGGMALLFGETVKYQAEDQIKSTLRNKVSTISDVIDQAETLAYGLNVSVTTLHVRQAETQGTYQELVRQLFQGRPEFVTGLGFGQSENGVLPSTQWLFPYYYAAPAAAPVSESSSSEEQPASKAETLYIDQSEPEYFYPETARYRDYFLPQESRWTTPYQSDRGTLLTYYSQMFAPEGDWLGTVVIDVDGTYLSQVLNEPVLRDGGRLMLLSADGNVIANPSQSSDLGKQTYQDIPGLSEIWSEVGLEPLGFLEGETGYWSYTQIPEKDWLLVAHVPYRIVFGRVMIITLGATTVVGLLLAGMVALVIRYLNRRLKPSLTLCQRLADMDSVMMEQLQDKDEIDQLSASFFYLLEQHQQHPSTVQQATQRIRLLAKALTAGEGQILSQWVTQAQQWADTSSELSQTLRRQALTASTLGDENQEALEASQEDIAAAVAKLEALRQSTGSILNQVQSLTGAAGLSTRTTETLADLCNVSKAFILSGPSLAARLSKLEGSSEVKDTITVFRGFTNRLKELLDQLNQVESEQRNSKQHIDSAGDQLKRSIEVLNAHLQALTNAIELCQSLLDRNQITVNQITRMSEQEIDSSQQLEQLSQTIRYAIQDTATSEMVRA